MPPEDEELKNSLNVFKLMSFDIGFAMGAKIRNSTSFLYIYIDVKTVF